MFIKPQQCAHANKQHSRTLLQKQVIIGFDCASVTDAIRVRATVQDFPT